jgi:hypothetical protein
MSELITVPLAHKLPVSEALRLGASEHRDYAPGEDITVPRASAEMLAAAAHLQANPHNPDAVDRVLQRGKYAPAPAATATPSAPAASPVTATSAPAATSTGTPSPATASVTPPAAKA